MDIPFDEGLISPNGTEMRPGKEGFIHFFKKYFSLQ